MYPIYFLRHAEPESPEISPLTPNGYKQAKQLADKLNQTLIKIPQIITSPTDRSLTTATIIKETLETKFQTPIKFKIEDRIHINKYFKKNGIEQVDFNLLIQEFYNKAQSNPIIITSHDEINYRFLKILNPIKYWNITLADSNYASGYILNTQIFKLKKYNQ
jgi:hypothetical protein